MPDFKIGDRVVVKSVNHPLWDGPGVITNIDDGDIEVRFDREAHRLGTFVASDVQHAPDEPTDPRATAAKVAKSILGDAADVYDVVELAKFILGEGDGDVGLSAVTTPAPAPRSLTAYYAVKPKPFKYFAADIFKDAITVQREEDGSILVAIAGKDVALSAVQSAELTALFTETVSR